MRPVDARISALGEGPVFDPRTSDLLWVDLHGGVVHRLGGDSLALAPPVCAVLPATTGTVLVLRDRLLLLGGPAGWRELARVPLGTAERCNDAKADPLGRIWVGTMARDEPGCGALFRCDDERVIRLLAGTSISNGLGWSPDGRLFYHVDTPTRRIDVFDRDPDSGAISGRRPFVTFAPDVSGVPDGLTVDAEGGIWVALFGGGAVRRYRADGTLDRVLELPVSHPTSCAFGGADLRTLYVTTARSPGDDHPDAGRLYATETDVAGLPATLAIV